MDALSWIGAVVAAVVGGGLVLYFATRSKRSDRDDDGRRD
jgi:hypothetical protein